MSAGELCSSPVPQGLADTIYPYSQWKSGKFGFAQPPGSTARLILGVCGAGRDGEVSELFTDAQMSPDIPILCLFLLLIQSAQLGMAEPWCPWGAGLVSVGLCLEFPSFSGIS